MNYRIKNKIRKLIQIIFEFPLLLIKSIVFWSNKREEKNSYDNKLVVVCIAKNEGAYIKEWIIHHLNIGVSKIVIFDNDSTDDMEEIIKSNLNDGKVDYFKISGHNKQYCAYNKAIKLLKNNTKYIAFIDCDEFLMPANKGYDIYSIIDSIISNNNKIGGVAVNWRMYGSSGFEKKPDGLVLSSFLYRANDENGIGNNCIKTICNPRKVFKFRHSHYPVYYLGIHNVDEDLNVVKGPYAKHRITKKLRINHYFTKSKDEWKKRRALGKSDTIYVDQDKRSIEEFYKHDNNEVFDDIGLYYSELIRKNCENI